MFPAGNSSSGSAPASGDHGRLRERTVTEALELRRAARHYHSGPVPQSELLKILDQVRLTPSGWNLQPVHFVLVTGAEQKRRLRQACLGQPQVEKAPAVVVFVADLEPQRGRLEGILQRDLEAGSIDESYARFSRKSIRLLFDAGPFGVLGAAKAVVFGVLGWFRPMPMPSLTRRQRQIWSLRQAAMAAQSFLLLAAARGLGTCPMEGFDPRRVRRVLGIPRRFMVALVVTVGRAVAPERPRRLRLPLAEILHQERFRTKRTGPGEGPV